MAPRDYKLFLPILACLLLVLPGCDRDTLLEPPVQFWEPASGVPTGSILSLAVNGNGVIFAATEGAGILRSRDGGETWEYVNNGLDNLYALALTVDHTGAIFAGVVGTVYRSVDEGESWDKLDIDLASDRHFTCMTSSPTGDILAFGTHDSAYRSTDGGDTWQEMDIPPGLRRYTCAATDGDGTIFAGFRHHGLVILNSATLIRSTDNGESWHICSEGIPPSVVYALDVDDAGTIFVATNFGVFYSTSHGDFWLPTSIENLSGAPYSLAVSSHGSIFLGTSKGVFRSTDGGDSWTSAIEGLTDRSATSLLALPSGDICAGSFFGTIHTADEQTMLWRQRNTLGLPPFLRVVAAVSAPDGSILAAVNHVSLDWNLQSVARSSDNGESWTHMTDGIDDYIFSAAADGDGRIFLGSYGAVYCLEPGASAWESSKIAGTDQEVEVLAVDSDGRVYAGTGGDGIFRSDDGGGTWRSVSTAYDNINITDITISTTDEIFATTYNGILHSTDGGEYWSLITPPGSGAYITRIDCNSSGDLFVVSNSHLYRSNDDGIHWTYLPVREQTLVVSFIIDGDDRLWVGTWRNGIFLSTDDGGSWTALDEGEPLNEVTSFTIGRDRRIYAGTWWNGLYKSISPID